MGACVCGVVVMVLPVLSVRWQEICGTGLTDMIWPMRAFVLRGRIIVCAYVFDGQCVCVYVCVCHVSEYYVIQHLGLHA